jgi:hypothetical protein
MGFGTPDMVKVVECSVVCGVNWADGVKGLDFSPVSLSSWSSASLEVGQRVRFAISYHRENLELPLA